MNNKFIILLLLSISIWACSSVKDTENKAKGNFYSLKENAKPNLTFTGRVVVNMDNKNVDLRANIYAADADSILMVFKAMFGIPAAKVFSTQTGFKTLNAFENTLITGSPNKKNIKEAVNINLSFTDLIALLRNEPSGNINDFKLNEDESSEEELLFYRYYKNEYIEYIKYDVKNDFITQYQQKSEDNKLLLNIYFKEAKKIGNRNYPHEVTALLPEQDGSIKFYFDEIKTVEKFNREFDFEVPSGVKQIKL